MDPLFDIFHFFTSNDRVIDFTFCFLFSPSYSLIYPVCSDSLSDYFL